MGGGKESGCAAGPVWCAWLSDNAPAPARVGYPLRGVFRRVSAHHDLTANRLLNWLPRFSEAERDADKGGLMALERHDQLTSTWQSILTNSASPLGEEVRAEVARGLKGQRCPLCCEPMAASHLTIHQRGDWCRIAAVACRAKVLGLRPVPSIHKKALDRAGIPYAKAPTNKTMSASGNRLSIGLFTLPEVSRIIARTKAGPGRDKALARFEAEQLKLAVGKLHRAARQRAWGETWTCEVCGQGQVKRERTGLPHQPVFCSHFGGAVHVPSGQVWVRSDVAELPARAAKAIAILWQPHQAKVAVPLLQAVAIRLNGSPDWLASAQWSGPSVAAWLPPQRRSVLEAKAYAGWQLLQTPSPMTQTDPGEVGRAEFVLVDPGDSVLPAEADLAPGLYSTAARTRAEALCEPSGDADYVPGAAALMRVLDPRQEVRAAAELRWREVARRDVRLEQVSRELEVMCQGGTWEGLLPLLERLAGLLSVVASAGAASALAASHADTQLCALALFHLVRIRHPVGPSLALAIYRRHPSLPLRHKATLLALAKAESIERDALDQLEAEGPLAWDQLPSRWKDAVALSHELRAAAVRLAVLRAHAGKTLSPAFLERVARDVPTLEEAFEWQAKYPAFDFIGLRRPERLTELLEVNATLTDDQVRVVVAAAQRGAPEAAVLVERLLPRLDRNIWWLAVSALHLARVPLAKALDPVQVRRELERVLTEPAGGYEQSLRLSLVGSLRIHRWEDLEIKALLLKVAERFARPPTPT